MKYTVLVNQAGVVDAGLADQTDLTDWAICDYVLAWSSNPNAQRLGEHVWINYRHLLAEMPLLGLKTKGAVAKRIEKLRQLGLLATKADEDQRVFALLTDKFHSVACFRNDAPVSYGKPTVSDEKRTVSCGKHSLENQINKSDPTDMASSMPHCPHESIIAIYHEKFPAGSKVLLSRFKGSKREKQLTARWREDERHRTLEFWAEYFSAAADIEWLTGKNGRDWVADFEYLTSRRGFDKVLEQVVDHA